jgi:hypothetical protein
MSPETALKTADALAAAGKDLAPGLSPAERVLVLWIAPHGVRRRPLPGDAPRIR